MRLNFAQRPIFSGLRLFNEPEISDSGTPAYSPSRRPCALDFYVLKKCMDLSRVWTREPWISRWTRYPDTILCDMESRKVWICFLHTGYMRVHKVPWVVSGGTWRPSCLLSQTSSKGDVSAKETPPKKVCTSLASFDRALSGWNLKCGIGWRRGSTSGPKNLSNLLVSIQIARNMMETDRVFYPMAPQTITLYYFPICCSKTACA